MKYIVTEEQYNYLSTFRHVYDNAELIKDVEQKKKMLGKITNRWFRENYPEVDKCVWIERRVGPGEIHLYMEVFIDYQKWNDMSGPQQTQRYIDWSADSKTLFDSVGFSDKRGKNVYYKPLRFYTISGMDLGKED